MLIANRAPLLRLFMNRFVVGLLSFAGLVAIAGAQEEAKPKRSKKDNKAATAEQALQRMQLPAGLKADLWAAEPLLANPVAFCFDEQGRIYVAETFRLHRGVTDNRAHSQWLDDELAARTVADRLA